VHDTISREKTGGWLQHLRGKAARQHTARVISKVGLNLGGSDVDQWLLGAVLAVFVAQAGNDAQQVVLLNAAQPTLAALDPPGPPCEDRLRARFTADEQRQLHLHYFSWFVAELMLRQALADEDLRVRESAIYSLCQLRGPDAYRLLVETLTAAWGLSRSPDAGSVSVLEVLLLAQNPEIRVKALESLGATQATPAAPIVRRSLNDPDLDVLYAAVLSWIELEGESCLPELAGRIEQGRGELRGRLALALFHATNYLFMDVANSPYSEAIIAALETAL
jgi:HEAT repeat protein